MTLSGFKKETNNATFAGKELSWEEQVQNGAFADNFMDCFEPAIEHLARRKIKLAVNAGGSDTEILAKLCVKAIEKAGVDLKVAWISGDEVTGAVKALIQKGEGFKSLMHGRSLDEWGLEPTVGQCYLGGLGIAKALSAGADIVICGRVSDASPIIGAAA